MNIIPLTLALIIGTSSLVTGESTANAKDTSKTATARLQKHQDIIFLREEEKLARDVYRTLYQKWNLPIFENISQAEQRHMDRMGTLVERFQLKDPVVDDTVGVFTNTKLARLYKDLVARGSKSEVDALLVGATIEDLDIRDIRVMNRNTSDRDTLDAFAKLECGSRNHMRAFTRQLESRDVKYKANYLSANEIQSIRSASHERCGRGGQSMGRQGMGRQGHGQRGQGHGRR